LAAYRPKLEQGIICARNTQIPFRQFRSSWVCSKVWARVIFTRRNPGE
jgi:hypothetical protein